MLVISANEQRNLVNMNEVIEYAALALKEFSAERTITPIRGSLPFANEQNTALIMPSVAEGLEALGVKIVTVVPQNKQIGKKTINGIVMLSDFQTGEPLALLEGSYLTMIRTGALSGVATKYLARHNAKPYALSARVNKRKELPKQYLRLEISKKSSYTIAQKKKRMHLRNIYKRNLVNLLTFTRIQMKQYVKQRSSSQLRTQPHQSSQKSCKRRPRKRRRLIQTEHARTTLTCHS